MIRQCVVALSLIATGVALFYLVTELGFKQLDDKLARSEWPTTQGTVASSTVELQLPSDDNLDIRVEFNYRVDGTLHTRTQQWPVGEALFGNDPPEAKEALAKYVPGNVVTVYYNPEKPADAVVEPKVADFGWQAYPLGLAFIGGMILPIAGIVILIRTLYRHLV